jgi:PAS domain S-box-containing protein
MSTDSLQDNQLPPDLLHEALAVARMVAWEWDLSTDMVVTSSTLEHFDGGRGVREFQAMIHPEDRAIYDRGIEDAMAGRGKIDIEHRIILPDGEIRWHSLTGRLRPAGPESPPKLVGISQDITDRKRAEEALRQSEQELRDFVDNATVGLHWVGPDGTIIWANRAELEMLGYTEEEYVGRHISEFHVDRETIADLLDRLVDGQSLHDFEARLRARDGSIRHVLIDSNVLWKDGRFIHTRCFTRDITERKRADHARRESELRFNRFTDQLPGLAWIKDLDGTYVYANNAAARAFGVPIDELAGRRDDEIFDAGTAAGFRANDRRALESENGIQMIETLTHPDGSVHHSVVSKFPIPDSEGKLSLIGGIAIDITEQMKIEEALRQADRRKDEFLATLAHELRNPLAPIRNSLQILRISTAADPEAARVHQMLEQQVGHMVRLVDDLLEVSRITGGKIELRRERAELESIIKSAIETSRPLIEEGRHALDVEIPEGSLPVDADPVRLAQVIANVLNNAAKYTDDGGRIRLSVERDRDDLVIRIRDTGLGIPAEMLPRVFDMFAQVDRSMKRAQGGLGIGLALARSLVEMHDGTIEAYSDGPGRGSEFVIRLRSAAPIAHEAPAPSPPVAEAPTPAARKRILVVDDHKDGADSLAMLLKLLGGDTEVAYDGPAAIAAIRRFEPSIVLLDIGMPGMDGYEVARLLRQDRDLDDLVLIALTGWGQTEDRLRTSEAGFNEHWVKPVDPSRLRTLIDG